MLGTRCWRRTPRSAIGHHRDADGYLVCGFGGVVDGQPVRLCNGQGRAAADPSRAGRHSRAVGPRERHSGAGVQQFPGRPHHALEPGVAGGRVQFLRGNPSWSVARRGGGTRCRHGVRVLDSETVVKILEQHRERKRRSSRSALSGAESLRCLGDAQDWQPACSRDQAWRGCDPPSPPRSERHGAG